MFNVIPYKAEVYNKVLCNGCSFTNTGREDVSPVLGYLFPIIVNVFR